MVMVQYGVWPNCCNACDFCLRTERIPISLKDQINRLNAIKENISYIDWQNKYEDGISLLGGEIYFIKDEKLQQTFIDLIDVISYKILLKNKKAKYSTVTNGLYDPSFLYRVIDRLLENGVTISKIDVNFSYDLKYRYKTKEDADLVIKNINAFHDRYNYKVGVQMILTQYLIDYIFDNKFDINDFQNNVVPGCFLELLYPHPIATGIKLDDFNFKRKSFLKFCTYLKENHSENFEAFVDSVINSSKFKYTGLTNGDEDKSVKQQPKLTRDKRTMNEKCNHSQLYQCYSDSDNCMLCDLLNF